MNWHKLLGLPDRQEPCSPTTQCGGREDHKEWTKGPWDQVWDDGRYVVFLPNSYLGNHIAYTSNGGVPEDQERANARLIAASPTMAEYIEKKANEGDAEAKKIIFIVNGE